MTEGERKKHLRATKGRLLAAAAAKTLGRIRKDREKVEARVRPLLAHIEENLFDYNLNTDTLKRRCGVRDNNLAIRFTTALGKSPYAYIEQRRMETACRLLTDTDLHIWQIGELVGYAGIHSFSRAFERWSGVRPSIYRQEPAVRTATKDRRRARMQALRSRIQPWPDPGDAGSHRLELWLPADLHGRVEATLAGCKSASADDQPRLTERDVVLTALADWLQRNTSRP